MPTSSARYVLCAGTQTKYNPPVDRTMENRETAGDRRNSVQAYRRIPPRSMERMTCAPIEIKSARHRNFADTVCPAPTLLKNRKFDNDQSVLVPFCRRE